VIEDLIQEVAQKHGFVIGRDDPLLVLHTVNERLLQQTAQAQQNALTQFQDDLQLLADRWGQEAQARSERIITRALSAANETMAQTMKLGAEQAAAGIRAELDSALNDLEGRIRSAQWIAAINLSAVMLLIGAAVWFLGALTD